MKDRTKSTKKYGLLEQANKNHQVYKINKLVTASPVEGIH